MDVFGTSYFVLHREVVLLCWCSIIEKGPQSLSFTERFFLFIVYTRFIQGGEIRKCFPWEGIPILFKLSVPHNVSWIIMHNDCNN